MRRFSLVSLLMLGLAFTAAACDSDTDPSDSNTITFTSQLLPQNERPTPVVPPNADAAASGTATIVLRVTRDAGGNVTSGTFDFATTMTGFPANTTLTGAHIHTGDANSSGGVLINTLLQSGAIVLTNGSGNMQQLGVTSNNATADVLNNMIANPGGYYFNVHTTVNTGGAIRGQLVKQ